MQGWRRLDEVAAKLSEVSRRNRYEPYEIFDWPAALPRDDYWISPELMTCFGTDMWDELDEAKRVRLSHHEAVNFFSLNVHLIRELIGEVADRIYTTRYPGLSEFFHDFIAEENVHAWFFATFCQKYGNQLYATKRVPLGVAPGSDVLLDVTVFGRILIAEELCDFFNARMANDDRLPALCQQINRVHHEDESRHIAFGRQMMRALRDEASERVSGEQFKEAGRYLARYISVCLRSLYNRDMYRDAGLENPGRIRARLLASPGRSAEHRRIMDHSVAFLRRIDVIDNADIRW